MNKYVLAAGAALALVGATALQAAMPGTASYYSMQGTDLRASKLIGTTVYNVKNENIGEINELLLNGSGTSLQAVVLGVGGFLGVGERNVAVAPTSVNFAKQSDGSFKITINADKESLQKAPEIKLTSTGSM